MQTSPHTVQFDAADVFGGINTDLENVNNQALARMRDSIPRDMRSTYTQHCYPLYSLLQALGNPRQRGDLSLVGISYVFLDLLSLDIEGAELAVLKTVPWHSVDIELIMIEINHSDKMAEWRYLIGRGPHRYCPLVGLALKL